MMHDPQGDLVGEIVISRFLDRIHCEILERVQQELRRARACEGRGFGLRRCRYVGLAKAHLQHVITAAAMNLSRLAAWQAEVPRAKTRTSRFARLALAG
jgi:hypothetical protein